MDVDGYDSVDNFSEIFTNGLVGVTKYLVEYRNGVNSNRYDYRYDKFVDKFVVT